MKAPKTNWWRLCKWWWHNGHKRLAAVHLRRCTPTDQYDITPHLDALRYLLGDYDLGSITVDLMIAVPDVNLRRLLRTLAEI